MVTRSDIDYKKHIDEIYYKFSNIYGEQTTSKFIEFYKSRYDPIGRSCMDYRLAWVMFDNYKYIERVGTRHFACVGIGGTGKTTLMTNISYFFDPTFEHKNANLDVFRFVEALNEFPKRDAMKAIFMDEPFTDIPAHSKVGKQVREILGKDRQQKLFLGMCATDLKDIPTYVWSKLDGIFFLPYLKRGWYFENKPKKYQYIIQQIREGYTKYGYGVFIRLKRQKMCLEFDTKASTPFTEEEISQYLTNKEQDYDLSIKSFLKSNKAKVASASDAASRVDIINRLKDRGVSINEIGAILGLTRVRIYQILKESSI